MKWWSTLIVLLAACSSPTLDLTPSDPLGAPAADGGVDGPSGATDANMSVDAGTDRDGGTATDASPADGGDPPPPARFVQVAVGREHSCGLADDTQVWCWGGDLYGQLGQGLRHRYDCGTSAWRSPCRGWAEPVADLAGAKAIVADQRRTCALMMDGEVRCLGSAPFLLPGLPALEEISMSRRGLHGVDASGAVWWSRFWLEAERIDGIDPAEHVAAGDRHACALHDDGTVTCWGSNINRQLGVTRTATCTETCEPVSVPLPGPAVEIVAGEAHSCARLADARVVCWGVVGDRLDIAPELMPQLAGATALAAGSAGVVCGHVTNDALRCVSPASLPFDPRSLGPARRIALSNEWFYTDRIWRVIPHEDTNGYIYSDGDWARLDGRSSHACAVRLDGTIACVGADYAGQLAGGRWGAAVQTPSTIATHRPVDLLPPPPPPPSNNPIWERMRAIPSHCPLETAVDPTRVAAPRWEKCAFEPASCRALVTPGFSVRRGWHDGELGYFSINSVGAEPESSERRVTAVTTTDLNVLAAWAGPQLQYWCEDEPHAPRCAPQVGHTHSCRVADVAFGDGHLAASFWVLPSPTRILHAPMADAAARRAPTFASAFPLAAAASRSTVAFGNSGVPVIDNGRTIVAAPGYSRHLNARRSVHVFGADVLWWEQPDVLVAKGSAQLAAPLVFGVQSFASDGRDLAWFDSTPSPGGMMQLWTSPHGARPIVPRLVGGAGGSMSQDPRELVVGGGHAAWLERQPSGFNDAMVLNLADGTLRQLHVPYHQDATYSQLVRPLFVTESELYVATNGVRVRGITHANRVYRVPIQDLPVMTPGP